ncbi:MAG: two-component system, OmpR family, sensor histidine kinase VicK [Candidatus Parcubacteria bacterium]|nr:two-component system, OmpR family, sensor histidine kinase VicK [Candidatus Parcubacteria bacterium]
MATLYRSIRNSLWNSRRQWLSWKYLLEIIVLAGLYVVAARYGLRFQYAGGLNSLVWAQTGLALAALLIFGYRLWPAILIGSFLVTYFDRDLPFLVSAVIAIGTVAARVSGLYFLRHFVEFRKTFERLRDVFGFIFWGAVVSTFIGATIAVASQALSGIVSTHDMWNAWLAWWLGDTLGVLIFTPLILIIFRKRPLPTRIHAVRILEALVSLFIFILICLTIFYDYFGVVAGPYARTFLIFPFLIWTTVRFDREGAVISAFLASTIAMSGTALGHGPFAVGLLDTSFTLLQIFMASAAITALVLAVSFAERKRAEREVFEQRNKDEALLESIGEGVIATDTFGNITLYNKAAEDMLQIPPSEAIGRDYESVMRLENEEGVMIRSLDRPLAAALSAGKVFRGTTTSTPAYYYLRKDGSRFPIALTVSPIYMKDKYFGAVNQIVGVVNVFRDITIDKETDRTKTEFVSIASHQLRTPLSTMKWHSEILLAGDAGALSGPQREYVAEIYRSVERMIKLLSDLLSVSRIEMGMIRVELATIDVAQTTDEAIKDLAAPLNEKGIKIATHYSPDVPKVRSDKRSLEIVIQNLLSNSIKYSPAKSVIELSIEKIGERVRIVIADQGCGIPADDQKKVFAKFFRAENARSIDTDGTGLGLYIVKSVLEHIDGTISFTSVENKGTTFYVSLPLIA